MTSSKLLIVTTVPETLATILRHQPRFLASALAPGVAVELVTSPGPKSVEVAAIEGLTTHGVNMARGMSPLKDLASIYAMARLLRRVKPAAVHSYTAKAGLIAMLAAWLCRIPVRIHTFTGLVFPTEKGLKRAVLIAVDRLICACASIVVPEGEGVKNDLRNFGITRKPLALIGHGNIAGVDTAYFDPDREDVKAAVQSVTRQLQLPPDAFVYCYVGRLNRDKGISELLAAFVALPECAHLLIVGDLDASAPIREEDQRLMQEHPRVHPLGFLNDIRPPLRLSHALVLPSYREGFPNAVLQGGAMGLPVIATDINGCNEVVEQGLNGWLVKPRSITSLHEAMQSALDADAQTRRAMGLQARQRIAARFERKQHWKNMVDFYARALGSLSRRH
jgi:glycosyltransferase involved in cell wall biosynthesis